MNGSPRILKPLDPRGYFSVNTWRETADRQIRIFGHADSQLYQNPRELFAVGHQALTEQVEQLLTTEWKSPPIWTARISEAGISPPAAHHQRYRLIFSSNHYLAGFVSRFSESEFHQSSIWFDKSRIATVNPPPPESGNVVRVSGPAVLVPNFANLNHLLSESLPNLLAIEELLGPPGKNNFQVISSGVSSALETFLDLLGYPMSRVVDTGRNWVSCENLWVSCFGSFGHLHTPSSYLLRTADLLKDRGALTEAGGQPRPRKLYVSRRNAVQRRILGEGALISELAAQGFEWVEPGSLGIRDQMDLFMDTEIVVGSHGMGLSNALFSRRLEHLVEILPTSWVRSNYLRLAQLRGARYTGLVVASDPGGNIIWESEAAKVLERVTRE